MQRLAMRHELIDGDSLLISQWCPDRVGYGGASYATCFQLVDTDRLSNPYQAPDNAYMRGGVELHTDNSGRVVALHVRKAEPNNWYLAQESVTWERMEKFEPDGWQRVLHSFQRDRADQHRGISIFVPILAHMKMLAQYLGVELQAATVAAQLGLFVQSPYDPGLVQEAIGDGGDDDLMMYQGLRSEWHKEHPAMFNGVRVPVLAPGEQIASVETTHPNTNFGAFSNAMLSIFASATGLSVESITQDWTRSTYSSARASLAETWKTLMRRREDFATGVASPMYATWLQEAMEKGELPLPYGAPSFVEARTAYSRAMFLGPPRGWIDGTKEASAAILRMDAGVSTLKQEAAEQGRDYEAIIEQRAVEMALFKKHGIAPPSWSNMVSPNMELFGETESADASNAAAPAPK
jgi:lambda family phage portal protein